MVQCGGGNDHYYQPVRVQPFITWTDARNAATAAGGYLVTLTSAVENAFVFSLIDNAQYWAILGPFSVGPWIGAFQGDKNSEPAGNWQWVTGEPLVFTNWGPGQPDNTSNLEELCPVLDWAIPSARPDVERQHRCRKQCHCLRYRVQQRSRP